MHYTLAREMQWEWMSMGDIPSCACRFLAIVKCCLCLTFPPIFDDGRCPTYTLIKWVVR